MVLNAFAVRAEELPDMIDTGTVWSYFDDNSDPAGDPSEEGYSRTAWTAVDFDDSAWETGAGGFGAKNGGSYSGAAVTLEGCPGINNTPAYFFRTTFTVTNIERYTKLIGSLEYDDGVIVYINGQRVAAGHDNACDENGNSLGHGFDANLQYGGSNQGPDPLEFTLLDMSILRNGENTIAVELHNGRKTSSDVWFSFGVLFLSTEEVVYQNNISLSVGADESQMNFTWYSPLDKASVTVSENSDMSVIDSFTIKRSSGEQTAYPIIEHIYGGGNKGETPISNSFIELYNPSDEEIALSDYTIRYEDKTLTLNGAILANGSYLILGAAEATTDEFLTYDLPEADQTCDWTINNKSYTIELLKGGEVIDTVTAGNSAETKISKQKSLAHQS